MVAYLSQFYCVRKITTSITFNHNTNCWKIAQLNILISSMKFIDIVFCYSPINEALSKQFEIFRLLSMKRYFIALTMSCFCIIHFT